MANTGRLAQPAPELQDLSPLNEYIGAQSGRWTFCGLDLAGRPDTCVAAECERDESGKLRIVSVDFGPIELRLAAQLAEERLTKK